MELYLVYLFAFANIILFILYIRRYGINLAPGMIVLSFYVLVACLAIPAYSELPQSDFFSFYNFREITLFPYIVYFFVFLMLIKPTFEFQKVISKSPIVISIDKAKIFVYIYIAASIITIFLIYRTISVNSVLENMAEVRRDFYAGEGLIPYNNAVEHFITTFTMAFQIPATIILFVLFTKPRSRPNFMIMTLFALCIIVPAFLDAVRTVSRGMVVSLFIRFLLCYGMLNSYFSKKLKSYFVKISIVFLGLFVIYSLLVTEARFGEAESGGINSLVCYWGQPTIIFNSQVMEISEFSYGKIFFLPLYEAAGIDNSALFARICKGFGPCFTTAIGTLYLDFGIVGILLIAIFIPAIINKLIIQSKTIDISKLYLILFYCSFLQNGALTMQWGYISHIGYCVFFYFTLKYLTPNRRKNKLEEIEI